MDDIAQTGKKFVGGLKDVPSKTTFWMVAGAVAGLLVGVMAMHAWFANKPSWTPKFLPGVPVPPAPAGTEPVQTQTGGF